MVALSGVIGCEFGLLDPRFSLAFKDIDGAGESESIMSVLRRPDDGDVLMDDGGLSEIVSFP